MSEGREAPPGAQWLGVAAVDGARVGPFELVRCDAREGAVDGAFDVYVDGFDEPLAFGVSVADADSLTRRFMSSIADWDAKLRLAPRASAAALPGGARRSSSHGASRSSSRTKRRLPRTTTVMLFLGVVAVLSAVAYYFGTTHPPDTSEPPTQQ